MVQYSMRWYRIMQDPRLRSLGLVNALRFIIMKNINDVYQKKLRMTTLVGILVQLLVQLLRCTNRQTSSRTPSAFNRGTAKPTLVRLFSSTKQISSAALVGTIVGSIVARESTTRLKHGMPIFFLFGAVCNLYIQTANQTSLFPCELFSHFQLWNNRTLNCGGIKALSWM